MKKLFLLLLVLLPISSFAQGLNADGNDYYIGWLYPSYNSQSLTIPSVLNFFEVSVLVSSYSDNTGVTISYFDNKTGVEVDSEKYVIGKRRSKQVPINMDHMRMDAGGPDGFDGEVVQWRAMHISSTKPINVQFFSSGANSGGSYLAIPTRFLGKNYVVESYQDNTGGAGGLLSHENSSGHFMVVAAYDSTTVQITPNATTKVSRRPGVNCGEGATGVPQPFT
ncbi:MAG TPA: hypothetical protein VFO76_03170, partial [Candidatus Kapabacteria bacterium]|nr:hypothetical protein [Candidatus Kapabacteria bacterium]